MKHALLALLLVWAWVDDSGTFCFVGDAKLVPARYAERAVQREVEPLQDYEKFTHTDNRRPGLTRRHYFHKD